MLPFVDEARGRGSGAPISGGLEFQPGTVATMELGAPYRAEQPESLERPRRLIAIFEGTVS